MHLFASTKIGQSCIAEETALEVANSMPISHRRAPLAAELVAAEELVSSNPAAAASAKAAADAAALLERATGGGHYGPASHMYDGYRPSRFDFGSMWAGKAI
jgi:hypothetical protein